MQTGVMEVLDEARGLQAPRLTVKQRQEKLFEELDQSGLESWSPKLADSAYSLLAEYHNVFSLEPSKLSCTHSTKHVIKVTNNNPFKEWNYMDSTTISRGSLDAPVRNVGLRCDLLQPKCMV